LTLAGDPLTSQRSLLFFSLYCFSRVSLDPTSTAGRIFVTPLASFTPYINQFSSSFIFSFFTPPRSPASDGAAGRFFLPNPPSSLHLALDACSPWTTLSLSAPALLLQHQSPDCHLIKQLIRLGGNCRTRAPPAINTWPLDDTDRIIHSLWQLSDMGLVVSQ